MGQKPSFRETLARDGAFTVTYELVPGRSTRARQFRKIIRFLEEASSDDRLHGVSITENAGGHPALSPEVLGREIKARGLDPILHFSCKDKNRNQIESTLFARDREGLHNLLIITGDYPRYGFMGKAKPVFDLDAVHLLRLISAMEEGFVLPEEAPGGGVKLPPMPFFKGCVVSPFKRYEAELLPQYYKLHRKIAAGAHFIITQVGFDARKFHELLLYLEEEGLKVPLLGSVLVMDRRLARIIFRGVVPGVRISRDFLARVEEEEEKLGPRAALIRAAKLIAVLQGMGYKGVHLCGAKPVYEDIVFLLEKAQEFAPRWQEFVPEFQDSPPDTFYLFRKDPETGLNLRERNERADASRAPFSLLLNLFIHDLFFEPGKGLYPHAKRLAQKIAGSRFEPLFTRFEYTMKQLLFDCERCGDCTLGEMAFLCPQSQCAKGLLNGPCGGSQDGHCEVYPEKRCLYVRVYERLKALGQEEELKEGFIPPRDWGLTGTSSWLNFYLGRDHHRHFSSPR
ncbi:MAG: methylenetetrahydrofolate reductase [Thermodesulfobacteria bacterium]|nr:methylenetetrahydrofolate reductase [Thermodesulfobacteriota bacterium]